MAEKQKLKKEALERSTAFLKKGDLGSAVQALESARSLDPDEPEVIRLHRLIEDRMTGEASVPFQRKKVDPDAERSMKFEAAWKQGIALYNDAKYERAAALFRQALSIQPDASIQGWLAAAEQRMLADSEKSINPDSFRNN